MSLDPASGMPTSGVPSVHGADSVHGRPGAHDVHAAVHQSAHQAHQAAHQAAVHRSTRRHVHVCDDPDCRPVPAGPWAGRLALAVFAVLAVVVLAVFGLVGRELLSDGPGGSDDASCTLDGRPVACPPLP